MAITKYEKNTLASMGGRYSPPIKNRMSLSELQAMHNDLQKYYETKMIGDRQIRVLNEMRWLYDKGGVTKDGAVIISGYVYANHNSEGKTTIPSDCDPIVYQQLQEDLYQYRDWRASLARLDKKRDEYIPKSQNRTAETRHIGDILGGGLSPTK